MKKIKNIFFIQLFLFFQLFFMSSAKAEEQLIISFGDSTTEGECREVCNGYPELLSRIINRPAKILNAGKGGEMTHNGITRLRTILAGDYTSYLACNNTDEHDGTRADFVLIMEGANDIIAGISPSTVKFNLEIMINETRAAFVTPIVATITANTRDGFGGCNGPIIGPYNQAIRDLAREKNVLLADQCNATDSTWSSLSCDGLHPNLSGDQRLVATWLSVLPPDPEHLKGDIDGDGHVDLVDAVAGLRTASGQPLTTRQGADVNCDRRVGLPEALYGLRQAAELP